MRSSMIVFLLLALPSLGQTSTAYEANDYTSGTVVFKSLMIQGVAAVTTEEKLYEALGEPDSIFVFSGGDLQTVRTFNTESALLRMDQIPKGGIPRAGIFYDHFSFALTEGLVYLSNVDFKNTAVEVVLPEITLSSETTLEEIKQLFPYSFRPKGYGTRGACLFVEDSESCDLVVLSDYTYQGVEYPVPIWTINLAFIDGKLAVLSASKLLRYDN